MAARTVQVDVAVPLDPRPARWRVGLIALATDHTTERDFMAMLPSRELAIYVNRVANENPNTPENLVAMRSRLAASAELILPDEALDAIAYSCTAASALIGDSGVRDIIQSAKAGVPVVTPTSAAIDAFAALRVRRISLLTPYAVDVTKALAGYFEDNGIEVLNASYLGISDDREIARVPPDFIATAAAAARDPGAEALFISCTALRAVAVLQAIEEQLSIPAISSNQAMFWRTIRAAGCTLPIIGYGRLMKC